MKIQDYLDLPYSIIIKKITDESGTYYHAAVQELEGCQSTADSFEEAYTNIYEAMEGWIETKLENGFDLSDYDKRCLEYAKEYAIRLLSIDVNIKIDEMLNTAWELFAKYFSKAEIGIKQVLIDKYWKEN